MSTVGNSILRRIRAKKFGWVFTPKNFIDIAARNVIDTTLHRLTKKGIIRKLDRGIYDFPAKHLTLGVLAPSPDAIAQALAKKSGDVAQPSGAHLANQLGFDNQVPSKPTYLTSGSSTKKNIANYPITLSHSKFLNNIQLNTNTIRVINALQYLGKNNITDDVINRCSSILSKKDKSQLKKILAKFPDWMVAIILTIIGKTSE
jgi:hypothetical protein